MKQTDIHNEDVLIRALTEDGYIRVSAVCGTELVREARRVHALSRVATAALGRQLMMTAIMAAEQKGAGERVSTILKGGGPGGNLVCTGDTDGNVKGTVGNPSLELPPTAAGKLDVGGYVGRDGQLTVVRDLGLREPYVGSSALVSGEIAEDFAQYYLTSQQQESIVYLGVRVNAEDGAVRAAGGLTVQPMPGCPEELIRTLSQNAPFFAQLTQLLDEGTDMAEALKLLFVGFSLRIEGRMPVRYRCDCSRARIEQALISVGRRELRDMIEQDGGAQVTCHFCNTTYAFTADALENLLAEATGE